MFFNKVQDIFIAGLLTKIKTLLMKCKSGYWSLETTIFTVRVQKYQFYKGSTKCSFIFVPGFGCAYSFEAHEKLLQFVAIF